MQVDWLALNQLSYSDMLAAIAYHSWPLLIAGFVAGFVDAIGGGGGLISTPALLIVGVPAPFVLGTNKGLSCLGSLPAALRYIHAGFVPKLGVSSWTSLSLVAVVSSVAGARLSQLALLQNHFTLLVPCLLVAVMLFMIKHWFWDEPRRSRPSSPGTSQNPPLLERRRLAAPIAMLAAYDGFFGPGTGTLLLGFFERQGLTTLQATATTKVFNLSSNIGALLWFASQGKTLWPLSLSCACLYQCGGYLGAGLVLKRGQNLVRVVVLMATSGILIRYLVTS